MADDSRPPLTDREREVWALLAAGMTDKQISARLGIAFRTVRVHVVSVAWKLHVPGGRSTRVLLANHWNATHDRRSDVA